MRSLLCDNCGDTASKLVCYDTDIYGTRLEYLHEKRTPICGNCLRSWRREPRFPKDPIIVTADSDGNDEASRLFWVRYVMKS